MTALNELILASTSIGAENDGLQHLLNCSPNLKYFVLSTPSFEKHLEEDGFKNVQIFKGISKSGIEDFSEAKWYIPNMKKVTVDDKTGFVERRHFDGHIPDDATIEIIQQQ